MSAKGFLMITGISNDQRDLVSSRFFLAWLGICLTTTQWEMCSSDPPCFWEFPEHFWEPSIQILIKLFHALEKAHRRATRRIGGLEKITYEKRLDEPALFSLNKRAKRRCKQKQASAKVSEYSLFFVVMVNWTRNSTNCNRGALKSRELKHLKIPQKVKFPSLEISTEVLNDICKEGEKWYNKFSPNSITYDSLVYAACLIRYSLRHMCTIDGFICHK